MKTKKPKKPKEWVVSFTVKSTATRASLRSWFEDRISETCSEISWSDDHPTELVGDVAVTETKDAQS